MAFNFCTTKRICYVGQYDRIDDLVTFNLRGDECLILSRSCLVNSTLLPSASVLIHSSSGILVSPRSGLVQVLFPSGVLA
jgi:hypothetical protein